MQTREKVLAGVLAAVLVGGVVLPRAWKAYNAPLKERQIQLELLSKKLDSLSFDKKVAQSKLRKAAFWAARSLPANPQNALLLYQQWVTDLAEDVVRLQNVNVAPERMVASREGAYVGVRVKVTGQGTMEQLCRLLYLLHEVDLMHRVVNLVIENRQGPDSDVLNLSLTLEGLSLPNAPDRGLSLFPRTKLAKDVDEKAKELAVESAANFPKKTPFRVRVDGELVRVVKTDGTTWTVQRGLAGFAARAHAAGTTVELFPVQPQLRDKTVDDYNVLVTLNPFVKPRPPEPEGPPPNFPPEIEVIDPVTVTPGELVTFEVSAWDLETPDKVTYSLGSGAPSGATIDPKTGLFQWQTTPETPPGQYEIVVQATDGGRPPLTASRTVTVTVVQDFARFTYLTAALTKDDTREAWLYDRSSNKRLILREGAHLKYAGVEADVVRIGRDFIWLQTPTALLELRLGDNLRTLRKLKDLGGPQQAEQSAKEKQTLSGSATDVRTAENSPPAAGKAERTDNEKQSEKIGQAEATASEQESAESPGGGDSQGERLHSRPSGSAETPPSTAGSAGPTGGEQQKAGGGGAAQEEKSDKPVGDSQGPAGAKGEANQVSSGNHRG